MDKTKKLTSVMVETDTHHIIKLLAVEKRMKIKDLLKQIFIEKKELLRAI